MPTRTVPMTGATIMRSRAVVSVGHRTPRTREDRLRSIEVQRIVNGGVKTPSGSAARKLDQSAARKVIHRKDVHSTLFALSGLDARRG